MEIIYSLSANQILRSFNILAKSLKMISNDKFEQLAAILNIPCEAENCPFLLKTAKVITVQERELKVERIDCRPTFPLCNCLKLLKNIRARDSISHAIFNLLFYEILFQFSYFNSFNWNNYTRTRSMYPQMQNIVADLQDAIISLNLRFCEKK